MNGEHTDELKCYDQKGLMLFMRVKRERISKRDLRVRGREKVEKIEKLPAGKCSIDYGLRGILIVAITKALETFVLIPLKYKKMHHLLRSDLVGKD